MKAIINYISNISSITVFILGLIMTIQGYFFQTNIVCLYIAYIGLFVVFSMFLTRLHSFLVWFFVLTLLLSLKGTTDRAENHIFGLISNHFDDLMKNHLKMKIKNKEEKL